MKHCTSLLPIGLALAMLGTSPAGAQTAAESRAMVAKVEILLDAIEREADDKARAAVGANAKIAVYPGSLVGAPFDPLLMRFIKDCTRTGEPEAYVASVRMYWNCPSSPQGPSVGDFFFENGAIADIVLFKELLNVPG